MKPIASRSIAMSPTEREMELAEMVGRLANEVMALIQVIGRREPAFDRLSGTFDRVRQELEVLRSELEEREREWIDTVRTFDRTVAVVGKDVTDVQHTADNIREKTGSFPLQKEKTGPHGVVADSIMALGKLPPWLAVVLLLFNVVVVALLGHVGIGAIVAALAK
jgi:hypothetical protein